MTFFVWFLLAILILFLILGIALVVAFMRLSRELQELGSDTEAMLTKTGRGIQVVRVAIPLVALIGRGVQFAHMKYQTIVTKKGARRSEEHKG
jgi:hypothetical protein